MASASRMYCTGLILYSFLLLDGALCGLLRKGAFDELASFTSPCSETLLNRLTIGLQSCIKCWSRNCALSSGAISVRPDPVSRYQPCGPLRLSSHLDELMSTFYCRFGKRLAIFGCRGESTKVTGGRGNQVLKPGGGKFSGQLHL